MAAEYPPPGHVLRRLAIEVAPLGEAAVELTFPVWPALVHPSGGVRTGVVVTAADVGGGLLAGRLVHPDWIATSGLSLDQRRPPSVGAVTITTTALRVGRTAAVLDFRVRDDDGECGHGTMTFSRLVRRDDNPTVVTGGPSQRRATFATDGPRDERPLVDQAGLRVTETGSASLDLDDTTRNSLGSVQGGMLGLCAEAATESAVTAALGRPCRVLDIGIDYVSIARVGPVEAVAEVVRVDGDAARARVEVHDRGAGRLAVIAHATAVAS